jgi:hypothetical protein
MPKLLMVWILPLLLLRERWAVSSPILTYLLIVILGRCSEKEEEEEEEC